MPEANTSSETGGVDAQEGPTVSEAVRATESYETQEGVVFYDAGNPLAWLQADNAVDLETNA